MSLGSDGLAALAAAFAASGLDELVLTGPGTDLHLRRPGREAAPRSAPPAGRTTARAPGATTIRAPGVGLFLPRHPLRAELLVAPDRRVRAGQAVALLRIGSLLRPVVAPDHGTVGAALVEEGAIVGFGTALFAFQPDPPEVPS